MRRCPQCWKERPLSRFAGVRKPLTAWCKTCRRAYNTGDGRPNRAGQRIGLGRRALRVRFVRRSLNRKNGGIPATISSGATCPPSCRFFGEGCYAEFHPLRVWWNDVSRGGGVSWRAFLKLIRALPPGQVWRHNEAGDLPGFGDALDIDALLELALANVGRRGFTFTHKPLLTARERFGVRVAVDSGFVINLSADSLAEADRLAELEIAPVAVVLPSDSPVRGLRTPAGRPIAVCPAQTSDTTCARCQLCTRAKRTGIVGVPAHGQGKNQIDELMQ